MIVQTAVEIKRLILSTSFFVSLNFTLLQQFRPKPLSSRSCFSEIQKVIPGAIIFPSAQKYPKCRYCAIFISRHRCLYVWGKCLDILKIRTNQFSEFSDRIMISLDPRLYLTIIFKMLEIHPADQFKSPLTENPSKSENKIPL